MSRRQRRPIASALRTAKRSVEAVAQDVPRLEILLVPRLLEHRVLGKVGWRAEANHFAVRDTAALSRRDFCALPCTHVCEARWQITSKCWPAARGYLLDGVDLLLQEAPGGRDTKWTHGK